VSFEGVSFGDGASFLFSGVEFWGRSFFSLQEEELAETLIVLFCFRMEAIDWNLSEHDGNSLSRSIIRWNVPDNAEHSQDQPGGRFVCSDRR